MPTNQILAFCPTDTGTNLLSQSDYLAAGDRTNGNQPGVASSKLNNKALRQSAFVAQAAAQMLSNQLGADVLDDGVSAKLLAQFLAVLKPYAPNVTKYTSGSSTWNMQYIFFIASGNATVDATYTNNAITFTVVSTVAAATEVKMTGAGDPTVNGTLTKASGTGDATLTFYAMRKPLYLVTELIGGGGGGGGSGAGSGAGGTGGNSTFGSSLLAGNGGGGGGTGNGPGGDGGTASLGSGPVGFATAGGQGGTAGSGAADGAGGNGAYTAFSGAGRGREGNSSGAGQAAVANTGAGGGGGSTNDSSGSGGGGAGGYVRAKILAPLSTYAVAVGAAGAAGAGANAGGAGGSGVVLIEEHYQ